MLTGENSLRKEAARARNQLSLEGLQYYRAKTAARLVLIKQAGCFDKADIQRVEETIEDFDRRIARRQRKLARNASRHVKLAASL